MSVRTALYAYLSQVPTLTAILGSGASFRAYPHFAGQGRELPLLVYRRLLTRRPYSLQEVGLQRITTIQIEVWGKSMAAVDELVSAVEAAMHAWSGTWDDVEIKRALIPEGAPDFDDDEEPVDGTRIADLHTIQQWDVQYQKAA